MALAPTNHLHTISLMFSLPIFLSYHYTEPLLHIGLWFLLQTWLLYVIHLSFPSAKLFHNLFYCQLVFFHLLQSLILLCCDQALLFHEGHGYNKMKKAKIFRCFTVNGMVVLFRRCKPSTSNLIVLFGMEVGNI